MTRMARALWLLEQATANATGSTAATECDLAVIDRFDRTFHRDKVVRG